jgi:thymidylate synthase
MSEAAYLNMLNVIMTEGDDFMDRTGTGCRGIFGHQLRFDLAHGFPLLTTKKLHTRSIIEELLWFLRGSTNNNELTQRGVHIWDEWAKPDGDLGPIYGAQWRKWGGHIDQIAELIETIKRDPYSRRQVVTAWNPSDLPQMALASCHCLFQTKVTTDGRLHLQLYQRSCDSFLGVPFNIASYALLLCMLADQTGYERGEFIWTGGDVHIYSNHFDQVNEQLSRAPRGLPGLELDPADSIDGYTLEHFHINGYDPYPAIKADVAV